MPLRRGHLHAASMPALGLASLVLAALLTGAAAQDVLEADFFGGRTINVCTSDYAPIVSCLDREPSQYTGYDIALFERVRQQMGWAPQRLNWTCMDWYEMLDHLEAGDGACDLAVAGVDISNANLDRGITFSLPTFRGGYKILVSTNSQSTDYWVFLQAFEWQLWLAMILTCIAVGFIVWAAERWALLRKPTPDEDPPEGLQERLWESLGRLMQTGDMVAHSSFTASLIILAFAFMMLILVTLYTGTTAANLTATQLQNTIRGIADLPGRRVGTWSDPEYITDLERRNIDALGYPWDTQEDLEAMLDAVRSGEIQALVLDSYILDFEASSNSRCDLATVGGEFEQYDQAVAFPSNTNNPGLIKEYNRILVALQETGDTERLVSQYITPEARCKASGVSEATSVVTFESVSGLWILLAAAVGVALLVFLASHLARCGAKRVARTQAYKTSLAKVRTAGNLAQLTARWAGAAQSGSGASRGGSKPAPSEEGSEELGAAASTALHMGPGLTERVIAARQAAAAGYEAAAPPPELAAAVADAVARMRRIEVLLELGMKDSMNPRAPSSPNNNNFPLSVPSV